MYLKHKTGSVFVALVKKCKEPFFQMNFSTARRECHDGAMKGEALERYSTER
jgi:hypothetical protein